MNITCVIGARGGSQGVPGKNIRPLLGKPLIAWSIEQALACPRIRRVVVSTDSPAIAEVARAHGGTVHIEAGAPSGTTFHLWLPREAPHGA